MAETRVQRPLAWLGVGLVAATLATAGVWLLFTAFMLYDDEGYVLLSLQNFSRHGSLYDRVYTQYGPFPYLCYDALHRLLGFEFTNTSGRWITWVNWLGTAGACAALVSRVTRSATWGAFTLAGVFSYLWIMINEPVHPGGLITLLVALAAWIGAECWSVKRIRWFVASMALVGAALLLTKINVGVFLIGALFTWLAVNTRNGAAARSLGWLIAVGCAVLPFGLMQSLLDAQWVQQFALVFTCGALSLLLAARHRADAIVGPREWVLTAAVGVGAVALLLAITLARGTSLSGLWHGILLDPLHQPRVYFFAMNWRPGSGVLALGSLALAGVVAWRGAWRDARFVWFVVWTRLAVTAALLGSQLGTTPLSLAGWGLSYGVSLAWLFAIPLHPDDRAGPARMWLALLLVFQCLHAFPVAGSQLNWGTFLCVPLLALGMADAWPLLREKLARGSRWADRTLVTAVGAIALVITCQYAWLGWSRYSSSEPLGIQGAEKLRMPHQVTYALRIVTENLRAHGDMLFSAPGLYSANLWTGLPTPTLANATHWFSLLTERQQQEIIDRLSSQPRAVVLIQRGLLDYLVKNGFAQRGPLQAWLRANFQQAFAIYPYEIWVKQDRQIAAFSTAAVLATPDSERTSLVLTLRAPAQPVHRIEVCNVDQPRVPQLILDGGSADVTITPIGLDGAATAPAMAARFPFTFEGAAKVSLRFTPPRADLVDGQTLLVLRDANSSIVGEVRVTERWRSATAAAVR